jgi:hypothetical protein
MRDEITAIADRPSSVRCDHPDDVSEVLALPGQKLHVRFFDGTAGIVDLSALISSPNAGVFSSLRDERLFAQVGVVLGAVAWPNGLDLAPDAMHQALSQAPEWNVTA